MILQFKRNQAFFFLKFYFPHSKLEEKNVAWLLLIFLPISVWRCLYCCVAVLDIQYKRDFAKFNVNYVDFQFISNLYVRSHPNIIKSKTSKALTLSPISLLVINSSTPPPPSPLIHSSHSHSNYLQISPFILSTNLALLRNEKEKRIFQLN